MELELDTAKVVSIEDKDKQGKIQINIESKFKNFKTSDYPWAIPLLSYTSDSTMNFNPPKKDSQIWILHDKYWKRFYYLSNRYFYKLFDFDKIKDLLDKLDDIDKEYKNLIFTYHLDKTLTFHNNKDGSTGIINPQGTILYINKDGSIIKKIEKDETVEIKGDRKEKIEGNYTNEILKDSEITISGKDIKKVKSNIDYTTETDISIKSKSIGTVEIGNSTSTIGSILTELCSALTSMTTVGSENSQTISPTSIRQITNVLSKIKATFK